MKLHIGLGILFLAAICCHANGQSPFFKSAKQIQSDTLYENVLVRRLFGDEKATGFVIWIKHKVPAHYHEAHSETVTILKGKAEMVLGANKMTVRKGDIIFIPRGTPHAVTVKKGVLKVLSIQAPEFDGRDRIPVKED